MGILYPFLENLKDYMNLIKMQALTWFGISLFQFVCVTTIGACVFRCGDFGCCTFFNLWGKETIMPTKENIELFKSALYEGVANKMREIEEEIKNPAMPPEIKRQKEEYLCIFLKNSDNK